jgi:hypothetical protein
MVHALHEAWRVLVLHGKMIDLRPYCLDAPLEVVSNENIGNAGLADTSADRLLNEAADNAISSMTGQGFFKEVKFGYFDNYYYWASIKEMLDDIHEYWKEDLVVPEEVLKQASRYYQEQGGKARLRLRLRTKLVAYEKL